MKTTNRKIYNNNVRKVVELYKKGVLSELEMKQILSSSFGEYVQIQLDDSLDKLYKSFCKSVKKGYI